MKLSDIRGKDSRELQLDVQSMRKELFELRFRAAAEEISNTSRFRDLRRQIARIQTVLRERELAGQKA
ncbi:MAG: 50S ribosomal protein L29 [Planctomycetota bacterium]